MFVVLEAALDFVGLNYFEVVVPRVKKFCDSFVGTGIISTFIDPPKLAKPVNNERCWKAAIEICKVIDRIKVENKLGNDKLTTKRYYTWFSLLCGV